MAGGEEGPRAYPLRGRELLDRWRGEAKPDAHEWQRLLFWVKRLMADPMSIEGMVRGPLGTGLPEYTAIVQETDIQVSWMVVKSPPYDEASRSVMLVDVRRPAV